MKKAVDIFFIILNFFIIYFLQSNFFTWFNIAGIMPNLFVVLIMVIGLFIKKKAGFIFGILFGLLMDLFIGVRIGVNAIALGSVGLASELLDKNLSKDNRITIMFLTSILTVFSATITYALQVVLCGANLQIFELLKIVLIEVFYNAVLIAIIYPFILSFGTKIENDFTNNSFLKFWRWVKNETIR